MSVQIYSNRICTIHSNVVYIYFGSSTEIPALHDMHENNQSPKRRFLKKKSPKRPSYKATPNLVTLLQTNYQ